MRQFLLLLLFPFILGAFEIRPVTPSPVLGYQEIQFFDEINQESRNLLVWYPVDPISKGKKVDPWDVFTVAQDAPVYETSKRPVVVISHGYTGNPHQMSWLIRDLVRNGYVVLGIQHRDLVDGKAHVNHWQRAQDVTTMINVFTKNNLSGFTDLNKIGIAGFSLGGSTVMWIAGGRATKLDSLIPTAEHASPQDYTKADEALPTLNKKLMAKEWRDPRVKAGFAMAPAWAWLFDEESLSKVTIPIYVIAASADKVLVTKNNGGFFARSIPGAKYQEIPGKGDHFIFISALNEAEQKEADPKQELKFLFVDDATIDRRWIQVEVAEEAVRFFDSVFNSK